MRTWFEQRTRSEQITLGVGAVVLLIALYFLAVIEPLTQANAQLLAQVTAAHALEQRLIELSQEIAVLHAHGGGGANFAPGASLLSVLTTSAHDAGMQQYTKKVAPVGANAVSLVLDEVPFAPLAAWLIALDREQGVEVERISVAATSKGGVVSAQLTLKARSAGS